VGAIYPNASRPFPEYAYQLQPRSQSAIFSESATKHITTEEMQLLDKSRLGFMHAFDTERFQTDYKEIWYGCAAVFLAVGIHFFVAMRFPIFAKSIPTSCINGRDWRFDRAPFLSALTASTNVSSVKDFFGFLAANI
jgi:hypothetical protein